MQQNIQYTLGKNERLKSRKAIEYLFKDGKAFSIFPIRVLYSKEQSSIEKNNKLRSGFSVSAKNFKRAVDRNRIKRLLRETYRLQKNELEKVLETGNNNWSVFFIYTGKELPGYQVIFDAMQKSILRLQKIANEGNTASA